MVCSVLSENKLNQNKMDLLLAALIIAIPLWVIGGILKDKL